MRWRGLALATLLLLTLLLLPQTVLAPSTSSGDEASTRQIAITIDDLPGVKTGGDRAADAIRVNERIVGMLKEDGIPAVGFVVAGRTFPDDPGAMRRILKIWTDAGMELGNHTAHHPSLHQVGVDSFKVDLREGLRLLREQMDPATPPVRYFRHPCLHTGRSLEIREEVTTLLAELNLTVGPVTFDNGEWIFAAAYHKAILAGQQETMPRIASSYIEYMERKLAYFEGQSVKLLGREMPQILLIHANALNADHLGDLLAMLRGRGYRFVTLDSVLQDEAFSLPDTFAGRGGISWLHRWAWTRGVDPETFFAGEPEVPEEILQLAGVESE